MELLQITSIKGKTAIIQRFLRKWDYQLSFDITNPQFTDKTHGIFL